MEAQIVGIPKTYFNPSALPFSLSFPPSISPSHNWHFSLSSTNLCKCLFYLVLYLVITYLSHTSFWHLSVYLHLSSYLLITISILSSCHLWWYHKFISHLSDCLFFYCLTFYFPFSVYYISIFSILVKWRVSQLLGISAPSQDWS